ncbi:hypothetical protein [Candidatus Pelagibacter sp. HIMB1746]|uniref:hypothetical protein n=1 Tax=Candidatus Pelagibacter sp. HIMB1746 TaxID=3413370 RepID=UPI003F83BC37
MKKILLIIILSIIGLVTANADDDCPGDKAEIILNLGGSPEPEKITYATYSTCSGMHDYCGTMGCSVEVFNHEGNMELGYIHPADWYIRPINVLSQIPTFELVMPLSNGKLRIVKVINGELTATVIEK